VSVANIIDVKFADSDQQSNTRAKQARRNFPRGSPTGGPARSHCRKAVWCREGARTQNGKVSPIRPGRADSHRCGSGFTRPGGISATTIRPADVAVAPREGSGRVQTGSSSSSPGRVTESPRSRSVKRRVCRATPSRWATAQELVKQIDGISVQALRRQAEGMDEHYGTARP
jgi:hypothetical protein